MPNVRYSKSWKINVSEIGCFRSQVMGGRYLLCWVPQKELTSTTE
jgi:hypothetical protein